MATVVSLAACRLGSPARAAHSAACARAAPRDPDPLRGLEPEHDDLVEQIADARRRARRRSRGPARTRAGRTPRRRAGARLSSVLLTASTTGRPVSRISRAIVSSPETSPSRPSTRKISRSAPAIARCPCSTTSSCSGSSLAPYKPAGVEQLEVRAAPRHRARERVARRAGHRRDDRAAGAGDPVEQRRLPHVRAADQHDRGRFYAPCQRPTIT